MAHCQPRRAKAWGREPATSAKPPVLAKGTTSEAANNSFGSLAVAIPESGTRTWPVSGLECTTCPTPGRDRGGVHFVLPEAALGNRQASGRFAGFVQTVLRRNASRLAEVKRKCLFALS